MTGQPAPRVEQDPPAAAATPQVADGTPREVARGSRADRWGWCGVGALTALMAAAWAPLINVPFGDNHLGRIIGRYALHLRNLQEQGLVGSNFSADWAPYSSGPYAHHPPLLNLLTALFGSAPGDSEYEVWLPAYLLALLVIPAAAALLRGFRIGWAATLLAVLATVATTFFWIYSPLMFDLGPILALSAAVVHLRERPDPPRWMVYLACAAALLATLVSWPGIAFAGALGLWLLVRRRFDRVTVAVGAAMVAGVALSLTFIVGVSGMADLSNQAEFRTAGGSYTVKQFIRRQLRYLDRLLPLWYLILLPIGVVAGLLIRRTRFYMAVAAAFAAGWVIVLNNGAYIHSYWSYPVLILGLVGIGLLLDWVIERLPGGPAVRLTGSAAVGVLLLVYFATLVFGPASQKNLAEPIDAGRLVAEHPPAPGQRAAWVTGGGLTTPRWLAYYWQLSPKGLTDPEALHGADARPEDLVLMDLRRRPAWLPSSIGEQAVAREGHYALFRVADLRAAAQQPR